MTDRQREKHADKQTDRQEGRQTGRKAAGKQTKQPVACLLCHAPLSFHQRPVLLVHHEVDQDTTGDEHNLSVARVQKGHHHGVHCLTHKQKSQLNDQLRISDKDTTLSLARSHTHTHTHTLKKNNELLSAVLITGSRECAVQEASSRLFWLRGPSQKWYEKGEGGLIT